MVFGVGPPRELHWNRTLGNLKELRLFATQGVKFSYDWTCMIKSKLVVSVLGFSLSLVSAVFAGTPQKEPVILDSISHNPAHYTQGLFFDGRDLVETTGLYGQSGLYRYDAKGKLLDSARIGNQYFGEGSIALGNDVYYLTWKARKGFVYSGRPFRLKEEFPIPTEGWGLTYWNGALLMSNGSAELLQIGLGTYYKVGAIQVTDQGRPVTNLNELEIVGNTLYANIWYSDSIAVIDLPSGRVKGYIDCSKLAAAVRKRAPNSEVLNGIAYDGKYLWITGKLWDRLYKIDRPAF